MATIFVGYQQNVSAIDGIIRDLSLIKNALLNKTANYFIQQLQINVHVWQPNKPKKGTHLRDEMKKERGGSNYVIITARKPYARVENRRRGTKPGHGPHNFGDIAYSATARNFRPDIIRAVNGVLAKHKTTVF